MLWVYLTLIAVGIWAVVNILDKYVISKYIRVPTIAAIIVGFIGLISSFLVFIFQGLSFPTIDLLSISLLIGIFYVAATVFYFKALRIEEASRVIPLFNLAPIFVLIMATFFLGEVFAIQKYFGIFLLILGSILISIRKKSRIKISKALMLMLLCSILLAVYDVGMKYLLNFMDYWNVFAWVRIGSFIGSLFILYFYLPELQKVLGKHGKRVGALLITSSSLNIIAILIITIALSIGFVSLVSALGATQPFFVLVYATLLSLFAPKILKEEIKGSVILLKIIAIVCMIIGAYLII